MTCTRTSLPRSRAASPSKAPFHVRAVVDKPPHEGHADRAVDDPPVVVRARRPAPTREDIELLLGKALAVLAPEQLSVNPDCGLKSRRWNEVKPALATLVDAARALRRRLVETPAEREP
jgi:hypothetical protein